MFDLLRGQHNNEKRRYKSPYKSVVMFPTATILFLTGFLCWCLSSIAAGGGALLFLPVARLVIEPHEVPVVIAFASVLSSLHRTLLYRIYIVKRVWVANVPGVLIGTLSGALLLKHIDANWLDLLVGMFLVALSVRHFFGFKLEWFKPGMLHFTGLSLITSSLSTVVGVAGPLMNPLYVGAGILKQSMIGTKAASTLFMQFGKLAVFASLGMLSDSAITLGCVVGVGALLGNWLGRYALASLSGGEFTNYVYVALLISGLATILRLGVE